MRDVPAEKRRLRNRLRAQRLAMSEASWAERCRRLEMKLRQSPQLARATHVASFWPMLERREVDLRPLHAWLRGRQCDVYYPFMRGADWGFARVDDVASMEPTRTGFLQPSAGAPVAHPGELEMILLPALAVTPKGLRLGYGAGFYDRLLAEFRPPAVAVTVVFSDEVLGELPYELHDQTCDLIITD